MLVGALRHVYDTVSAVLGSTHVQHAYSGAPSAASPCRRLVLVGHAVMVAVPGFLFADEAVAAAQPQHDRRENRRGEGSG